MGRSSFLCPYSPNCLEGEFSEVELPLYGVLGSHWSEDRPRHQPVGDQEEYLRSRSSR
jgi:hypothetical protein